MADDRALQRLLDAHGKAFLRQFDDADSQSEGESDEVTSPESSATASDDASLPAREDDGSLDSSGPESSEDAIEEDEESEKDAIREPGAPEVVVFRGVGKGASAGPSNMDSVWAERKAFMSNKAARVASPAEAGPAPRKSGGDDADTVDFKRLMWEVERFGASALEKKDQKKWKAAVVERLGGKAPKAPRMSIKIGAGISKKRKEREKKALELAFETGMATRKGRGKEKKRERDAKRDRGLQELHGYSDGMLRVSPSVFKTRTREDAGGGTRGLGSAFGLRGVGKGPRPKAKGKKKGKGSKKRR